LTVRIDGAAQEDGCFVAAEALPTAAASAQEQRTRRRPPTASPSARAAQAFRLRLVEIEITPEPTDEEREAILAALDQEVVKDGRDTPAEP
jgi:hypothetical protein